MRKRIYAFTILIIMVFSVNTHAASVIKENNFDISEATVIKVNEPYYFVCGRKIILPDAKCAYLTDNTSYIPIDIMAESCADLRYDIRNNKVNIVYDDLLYCLRFGSKVYTLNGIDYKADFSCFEKNGTVMIPSRLAALIMKKGVLWIDGGYIVFASQSMLEQFKNSDNINYLQRYYACDYDMSTSDESASFEKTYDEAIKVYVGNIDKEPCFKTISAAKEYVKKIKKNTEKDIVVYISGGEYYLEKPLVFDNTDSGENGHKVIYTSMPGEDVVISGGKKVFGWEKVRGSKNIYKASVDTDAVRQFYVNGEKRRNVSTDAITVIDTFKGRDGLVKGVYIDPEILPPNSYSPGIELFCNGINWANAIMPVEQLEKDQNGRTMAYVEGVGCNLVFTLTMPASTSTRINIRNAKYLLGKEGEWYFDPSKKEIYYTPKANEDIYAIDAVYPKTENMIQIGSTSGSIVSDIEFYGLTFSYCAWNDTMFNTYKPFQAGELFYRGDGAETNGCKYLNKYSQVPSGITLVNAKNIVFERNKMVHFGATVIGLDESVSNCIIRGNVIMDAVDSGITLGNVRRRHERQNVYGEYYHTDNIVISNNYISKIGEDHYGAPAIQSYSARDTQISNNHITDVPYTGICIGWCWANTEKTQMNVSVKNNIIENSCTKTYDGAGIYTLGRMDGSCVAENYIKTVNVPKPSDNIIGTSTMNYGIYLDQGSSMLTVENNVIEDAYESISVMKDYNGDYIQKIVRNNYSNIDRYWITRGANSGDDASVVMEGAYVEGPVAYTNDKVPEDALKIKINSGLTNEYSNILKPYINVMNTPPTIDIKKNFSASVYEDIDVKFNVTDDGYAFAAPKISWSEVSVPEGSYIKHPKTGNDCLTSVYIENPEDIEETKISFSVPGEYKLKISAYDGQYTASEIVTFNIEEMDSELKNIALGKECSCLSVWNDSFSANYVVDGDMKTEYASSYYQKTDPEPEYVLVDLGKEYPIEYVVFKTRNSSEQSDEAAWHNFSVELSNDKDFASYVKIGSVDATPRVPFACAWSRKITDSKTYRYVRIRCTRLSSYIVVPEFEIYSREEN